MTQKSIHTRKNYQGFSIFLVLLFSFIFAGIVGIGVYIYRQSNESNTAAQSNTDQTGVSQASAIRPVMLYNAKLPPNWIVSSTDENRAQLQNNLSNCTILVVRNPAYTYDEKTGKETPNVGESVSYDEFIRSGLQDKGGTISDLTNYSRSVSTTKGDRTFEFAEMQVDFADTSLSYSRSDIVLTANDSLYAIEITCPTTDAMHTQSVEQALKAFTLKY